MRGRSWQSSLGLGLLVVSALLYLAFYLYAQDLNEVAVWFLGSLAFLPVSTLIVTLFVTGMLAQMERRERLQKLNMVIGAFFSEVGTGLLAYLSDCDPQLEQIRTDLLVRAEWKDAQFAAVSQRLRDHRYRVGIERVDLDYLHRFLGDRRDFLLRLLENPTLLEHETFTELLRAVFHLTEELTSRPTLHGLPDADLRHLEADASRVYGLLVAEWLDYMRYLKENYPYLFSLAIRLNPFDQTATPVVS